MRIIKKYPNRRLYDTAHGTYITLEDVKKLVMDSEEFQVLDARTNKDLTQNTLMQIINEQEASNSPLFTTAMLQDFIRFYNDKSSRMLGQYLEQAMKVFIQQKQFLTNQWQSYQKIFSQPDFLQEAFQANETKSKKKKPRKTSKK